MAIVFLGENNPSQVYVQSKIRYAQELGIVCKLFGQEEKRDKAELLSCIHQLNADEACIGIIIQLPLPADLQQEKDSICAAVHPMKDIDGL
jgi:methylenetetrahydrofolate dehydrogenase (NADP+)/methenyltetrahydrofolate cyclohydrolase